MPFIGQAGAVRLGVARALEAYDPMLRPILKAGLSMLVNEFRYTLTIF